MFLQLQVSKYRIIS